MLCNYNQIDMKYYVYVKGQSVEKSLGFLRLPLKNFDFDIDSINKYLASINQSAIIGSPYLIVEADYDENVELLVSEQFKSLSAFLGVFGGTV